ncbi:TetR/AcrR family transcriptional regulator [Amedibacillus sp. YH-ame10]
MKQAEKSKATYDKILHAAILEFGSKSYEGASLNNVCNEYNISKGLIYHNFKNKDDLYLQCTSACFQKLSDYLSRIDTNIKDVNTYLKNYLNLRVQFFHENPAYGQFFFHAILQPPKHLINQIKDIRKDFDAFNVIQFSNILQHVTLRQGITQEDSLMYFTYFQDMFHNDWGNKIYEGVDFDTLMKEHETKLGKMIDMLLYGIVKENTTHESTHH